MIGLGNMTIVDLATSSDDIREQAASLLVDGFHEPRGWPDLPLARQEVAHVIAQGFARGMICQEGAEGSRAAQVLLGWIGGVPNPGYNGNVWELHPMVVREEYRRRGIGRALVAAFEFEAGKRGALTATLGTDDDSGMTSLSDVDLYADVPRRIAELRDLGRGHPFLFYRKVGFVVTGVMPDANGRGRPDIYMSKPIAKP